jgi:hypothetical protein
MIRADSQETFEGDISLEILEIASGERKRPIRLAPQRYRTTKNRAML